ncbi:MAG: hypothetical protein QOF79_326 [Actinomycetota bacterium]|jgi:hypothetical protein|nr:hypothetical protein [Actinomycetota bacterium]
MNFAPVTTLGKVDGMKKIRRSGQLGRLVSLPLLGIFFVVALAGLCGGTQNFASDISCIVAMGVFAIFFVRGLRIGLSVCPSAVRARSWFRSKSFAYEPGLRVQVESYNGIFRGIGPSTADGWLKTLTVVHNGRTHKFNGLMAFRLTAERQAREANALIARDHSDSELRKSAGTAEGYRRDTRAH